MTSTTTAARHRSAATIFLDILNVFLLLLSIFGRDD
jgi:FtsH-binding integral membrane protein